MKPKRKLLGILREDVKLPREKFSNSQPKLINKNLGLINYKTMLEVCNLMHRKKIDFSKPQLGKFILISNMTNKYILADICTF